MDAIIRDLKQKQRHCTRLQAAVQAASDDLAIALSQLAICQDRLDHELAVGQSTARQSISMFVRR